jgi:hypothetical protein
MERTILVAAGAACLVWASAGQAVDPAPATALPAIVATPTTLVLPANAELTVTPNTDLSSKSLREGDSFVISTVYDVLKDGYVVIPRGTRGQGKVIWRTGKGAFGKSAKMEIAFEWIEVAGRRVVIEGKHRQEGSGNTAATIGTAVAVGVFSAFVTGKSASIPHGMQLKAYTAEPLSFQIAGLPAPAPTAQLLAPASGVTQGTSPLVTSVPSSTANQ